MELSLPTLIVKMLDSGNLLSECEAGKLTETTSGGLNCVVSIKNVSNKKATSTIGVISSTKPTRLDFTFGIIND